MNITDAALIAVSTFNLLIGLFVLLWQPRKSVHQSFFLAVTGTAVWGFGLTFLKVTRQFQLYDKVTIYGFILFLFGFVWFARVFPKAGRAGRKFYLLFLPLVFLCAVTPFNLIIRSDIFHADGSVQPQNGPLFGLFGLLLIMYVVLGLIMLIRTYKKSSGLARLQLNYLLFGLSFFLGTTIIFSLVLPAFGLYNLNFLGPLSSLALTVITAYAIVRHHLLDIRVIIQRGLIYTVLSAIVIAIYVIGLQFMAFILHEVAEFGSIVSGCITTTVGVFLIPRLEKHFQRLTDPIFFRDSYDYGDTLKQLSHALNTHVTQADIVRESCAILEKTFKPQFAEFKLGHDSSNRPFEAGISVPIIFQEKEIGMLTLGPKRSGDAYSPNDMKLLETFAIQAAVALEKARLFEKVEEYSTSLEQLVEQRTQEIKKLQEEQRETMIDISHNLQTPLAVIKGELELLPEYSGESEKMLTVKKSLDRVSAFIRQLLHLAKLEQSAYIPELVPIDIAHIASAQADYFSVMSEDKGVRIETDVSGRAIILGNKRLLEELFTNLLMNAITYRSPTRPSVIKISLEKTPDEVRIIIEDNGIGIAREDQQEIFTRFYRSSRTPSVIQGSGLGLAIVKQIVERHAGAIKLESKIGEKTVFTIIFARYKK